MQRTKKLFVLALSCILMAGAVSTTSQAAFSSDSTSVARISIVEPGVHVLGYIAQVKTTSGNLNVRSGPGTNYEKVGSLSSGSWVKIYGSVDYEASNGWYYIKAPMYGWVHSDYLTNWQTSQDW